MSTLNSIETEGNSPFGKLDLTDPGSYARVAAVGFVMISGLAGANFAFNEIKSRIGTQDLQVPVVGDLA